MADRVDAHAVFEYTALDKRGKKVSGVLDAEGLAGARTRLRATGIYPVTLREVAAAASGPEPQSGLSGRLMGKRVKPLEVSLVTRQLATLLGAGFPLVQALDALIPQTPSAGFQKKLTQIKDAVVGGSSFADALGRAGETLPAGLCQHGALRRGLGDPGDRPRTAGRRHRKNSRPCGPASAMP